MSIGFFGDSYCSTLDSKDTRWETYISLLAKHFNCTPSCLGTPGSSITDCILNQFLPLYNSNMVPDISIFCWTDPVRVYSKAIKNLTVSNCALYKDSDVKEYEAGYSYFKYLYDEEETILRTKALLYWFDREILSSIKSKVVHLFSITNYDSIYLFNNGTSFTTPLREFVNQKGTNLNASNHINGKVKNKEVFELILKHL